MVSRDLLFLYFGVIIPGSTNDNISYSSYVELKEAIKSLPLGLYSVADAAYTLSERLLIPCTGFDCLGPTHDAFNTENLC
jgi:hypothetical protein